MYIYITLCNTAVYTIYMYMYMLTSCRLAADQRLSEALSNLEKAAVAHSEKVSELQEGLATQKQLASKYNDKVSIL